MIAFPLDVSWFLRHRRALRGNYSIGAAGSACALHCREGSMTRFYEEAVVDPAVRFRLGELQDLRKVGDRAALTGEKIDARRPRIRS